MLALIFNLIGTVLCSNILWLTFIALFALRIYLRLCVKECQTLKRLFGKTIIITGPTSGIGKEIAIGMAFRGCNLILACRDLKKGQAVQEEIYARALIPTNRVKVLHLDLSSLASVRKFVEVINETEDKIDVLINNAGETGLGNKKTSDGLNIGMQVNHFAPFLLTTLLMDKLKQGAPSRVVWLTSSLSGCAKFCTDNLNFDKDFSENQVYFCSKMANILIANELAKRVKMSGVTVNTVNPGFTPTKIWKHFPAGIYEVWFYILKFFCRTNLHASYTPIYLAVDPHLDNITGKHFEDIQQKQPPSKTLNQVLGIKLYEKSVDLVGLEPHEVIQ